MVMVRIMYQFNFQLSHMRCVVGVLRDALSESLNNYIQDCTARRRRWDPCDRCGTRGHEADVCAGFCVGCCPLCVHYVSYAVQSATPIVVMYFTVIAEGVCALACTGFPCGCFSDSSLTHRLCFLCRGALSSGDSGSSRRWVILCAAARRLLWHCLCKFYDFRATCEGKRHCY